MQKTNIILIGMPGSGKSTVGIILAKLLQKRFLDTDILIQNYTKKTLQEIVDSQGHMCLREIEEKVLLKIRCHNHIIATGGSAAYSTSAMNHLRNNGHIIFLHTELATLKGRIHNYANRGLAKRREQTLEDLFMERQALYEKFTDIIIKTTHSTQDQVCDNIRQKLQELEFLPSLSK